MPLLNKHSVRPPDWEPRMKDPKMRRATPNMVAGVVAVEALLAQESTAQLDPESFGLITFSKHGELTAMKSFLSSLATTGVARPFFFQNSLHHATTGFLTQFFKIRGPSITLSNGARSYEDAECLAETLLATQQAQHILVVGVDIGIPEKPIRSHANVWLFGEDT